LCLFSSKRNTRYLCFFPHRYFVQLGLLEIPCPCPILLFDFSIQECETFFAVTDVVVIDVIAVIDVVVAAVDYGEDVGVVNDAVAAAVDFGVQECEAFAVVDNIVVSVDVSAGANSNADANADTDVVVMLI
jgi:hypothetical protein